MDNCIFAETSNFYSDNNPDVVGSIFKQYERVIVESLITSFGLDFIVKDSHGGDVDTIHNVRQIGKDSEMFYKNKYNQQSYENSDKYSSHEYHTHNTYKSIKSEISIMRKSGILNDAYTGERIKQDGYTDLDHVISAKEIHEDRGRILSGLNGADLANCNENLKPTNPHTNRTKKAHSMNEFLYRYGDEYTDSQKKNMRKLDSDSRKSYEKKISAEYYTSSSFKNDVANAAKNTGIKMGLRQAIGFVFAEIWFSVKNEFSYIQKGLNIEMSEFFKAISDGVKKGFENARLKYKEFFSKFIDGTVSGALSSITTTICNIFFTTSKNIVKIIRQSYVSIVEALKILFINPDNLEAGERIRAVDKVLAVGASVLMGTAVSETLSKTAVGVIPVVGDTVQTFCGTLVTGIMSCTLLYFLDKSELSNKLVSILNNFHTISTEVNYFKAQAEYFEKCAAEIMSIDIERFRKETYEFNSFANKLDNVKNESELNFLLKDTMRKAGISSPYGNDFDSFMRDKSKRLVIG